MERIQRALEISRLQRLPAAEPSPAAAPTPLPPVRPWSEEPTRVVPAHRYPIDPAQLRARCVLLAESFSGPIAIRVAADPPPGLAGVILCGTFAKNPFPWLRPVRALAVRVPFKSLPRWLRAPLLWVDSTADEVSTSE